MAEGQAHLGQGVPSEAGGPCEGTGHSHGHQSQQPLRLVQNSISIGEAGSVLEAWCAAGSQLPDQLLPHTLCTQEEGDRRSEVGLGPVTLPWESPSYSGSGLGEAGR